MGQTRQSAIARTSIPASTPISWGLPPKFQAWRPNQFETVIDSIDSPQRFYALCAPVGSGKSPTYVANALISGLRTVVLVITKALQDQLLGDFRSVGLVDVRGAANYKCRLSSSDSGDYTCEEGGHARCKYAKSAECPRTRAVEIARAAPLVVTNYHYWCMSNLHGRGIGPVDQIVCDEAHDAPEALAGIVESEITERMIATLKVNWPVATPEPTMADWRIWAVMVLELLGRKIDQHHLKLSSLDRVSSRDARESVAMSNLERKLKLIAESEGPWEFERTKYGFRFAPLWPRQYAEDYLFRKVPRVFLTSATIRPKTLDLLGIAKSDYRFVEVESNFDPKRMPIYHVPTVAMKHTSTPDDLRTMYRKIDRTLESRPDRKALIHTVSYKRQGEIVLMSKNAPRMIAPGSDETATALERYKRRRPETGAVLIGPSYTTGYDLPYDQCEVNIIPKLPFADSRSKIQKARQDADPEYGPYQMAQALQQMAGRPRRAEDDRSETFIFDNQIQWAIRKFRRFFSAWFYKADPWSGKQIGGAYSEVAVLPPAPPALCVTGPTVVSKGLWKESDFDDANGGGAGDDDDIPF